MAFENGLNSTLPIQGLSSTNPAPMFTASIMDANANSVANTANTQANTNQIIPAQANLLQQQAAKANADTNLVGWQAKNASLDYDQAQAMITAGKNTVNQVFGPQAQTPTPSVASATPGVTTAQDANGNSVQQPAPVVTKPPTTKPIALQVPQNGVIPPAATPTPDQVEGAISQHNTTPSGVPNILSDDYLEAYKDNMLKAGVRLDTVNNTMAAMYKTRAELAKSTAETTASTENARVTAQKADANLANQVLSLNGADPSAAHNVAMQRWGIDTSTPGGIALLKSMATGSEQYKSQTEAGKAVQETATSKAEQTFTEGARTQQTQQETAANQQKQGLEASGAVADIQQEVAAKQNALNKTNTALDLANKFNVSGKPGATLGDLQNWFGANPQYAEYKAILSQDNLEAIRSSLAGSGRLSQQEFKQLSPTQVNPAMPVQAAIDMLKLNQNLQQQDLNASQTKAQNISKVTAPTGINTSGAVSASKPQAEAPKQTTLAAAKAQAKAEGVSVDAYVTALTKNGWTVK